MNIMLSQKQTTCAPSESLLATRFWPSIAVLPSLFAGQLKSMQQVRNYAVFVTVGTGAHGNDFGNLCGGGGRLGKWKIYETKNKTKKHYKKRPPPPPPTSGRFSSSSSGASLSTSFSLSLEGECGAGRRCGGRVKLENS